MAVLQSYEVPSTREDFEIQLPQGSQVLAFFEMDDKPYISVLVDLTAPCREPRFFTLSPLKSQVDTSKLEKYVGMAMFRKGSNPLHLFERKRPEAMLKVVDPAA